MSDHLTKPLEEITLQEAASTIQALRDNVAAMTAQLTAPALPLAPSYPAQVLVYHRRPEATSAMTVNEATLTNGILTVMVS